MALEGAIDLTIPTDTVKKRLRNLREHMPGHEEQIYMFGEFLAGRLADGKKINPFGFHNTVQTALNDLYKGTDSYTQSKIASPLAGASPLFYQVLGAYTPSIAKAVCPEDFAGKVEECYEKVIAELRKEKAEED